MRLFIFLSTIGLYLISPMGLAVEYLNVKEVEQEVERIDLVTAHKNYYLKLNWNNYVKRHLDDLDKITTHNPDEHKKLKSEVMGLYLKYIRLVERHAGAEKNWKVAKVEGRTSEARAYLSQMNEAHEPMMNAQRNYEAKMELLLSYLDNNIEVTKVSGADCDTVLVKFQINLGKAQCATESYYQYLSRTKKTDISGTETPHTDENRAYSLSATKSRIISSGCPILWRQKTHYEMYESDCVESICNLIEKLDGQAGKVFSDNMHRNLMKKRVAKIQQSIEQGKSEVKWQDSIIAINTHAAAGTLELSSVKSKCPKAPGLKGANFMFPLPSETILFCKDNKKFSPKKYQECKSRTESGEMASDIEKATGDGAR